MEVIKVTVDTFDDVVLKSSEPVLVDFWASWCGPCRMLSPVIAQVAAEAEGFKVASVNVDEEGELAQRYGVASIIPKDRILELVKGCEGGTADV